MITDTPSCKSFVSATLLARMIVTKSCLFTAFSFLTAFVAVAAPPASHPITVYVSNASRTQLLARQTDVLWTNKAPLESAETVVIPVENARRFQTIEGFGFALTGGSAKLLMSMSPDARHQLLLELFGAGQGQLHVSTLRLTIGASDMNDYVYTYDDGAADPQLRRFSLAEDEHDVIPVIKEILSIQPALTLFASPWTAPAWMKTNGLPKGGTLRPESYKTYAHYLVLYVQAMQALGIHIAAITPQNEPLNPKNTPSMVLEPEQEKVFVRDALGPALRGAGLATRIIVYDHNLDRPDYPEAILSDPAAAKFIDGSGFHLYAGEVEAMSAVHDAAPAKNIYFTEQMTIERKNSLEPVAVPVARVMIGATRNWSRDVLLWNLAADPAFGPHTNDGGCPVCQGAVTLAGDTIQRNVALYAVAQFSRFVPPGSVRIYSGQTDSKLTNVAFQTPDHHTVLIVTNLDEHPRSIAIEQSHKFATALLAAGDAVTYVW